MAQLAFIAAGGLASLWFAVHCLIGGRQIARPLRAARELDPVVRNTQYLCWHFTSVGIACMAAFFLWAGVTGDTAFAAAGTALAAGFSLVGVGLVAGLRESHLELPQGWLFVPVAGLGLVGLLA